MLVPSLLAVGLMVAAFFSDSPWLQAFIIVPVVLIPTMFAFGYWLRMRESLKRFRLLEDGKVALTVNDAGTIIESAIGRSESKWKIYTDLWEFPDVHLLFYGESQFITLPRDQVPPDFIEFVRRKLSEGVNRI